MYYINGTLNEKLKGVNLNEKLNYSNIKDAYINFVKSFHIKGNKKCDFSQFLSNLIRRQIWMGREGNMMYFYPLFEEISNHEQYILNSHKINSEILSINMKIHEDESPYYFYNIDTKISYKQKIKGFLYNTAIFIQGLLSLKFYFDSKKINRDIYLCSHKNREFINDSKLCFINAKSIYSKHTIHNLKYLRRADLIAKYLKWLYLLCSNYIYNNVVFFGKVFYNKKHIKNCINNVLFWDNLFYYYLLSYNKYSDNNIYSVLGGLHQESILYYRSKFKKILELNHGTFPCDPSVSDRNIHYIVKCKSEEEYFIKSKKEYSLQRRKNLNFDHTKQNKIDVLKNVIVIFANRDTKHNLEILKNIDFDKKINIYIKPHPSNNLAEIKKYLCKKHNHTILTNITKLNKNQSLVISNLSNYAIELILIGFNVILFPVPKKIDYIFLMHESYKNKFCSTILNEFNFQKYILSQSMVIEDFKV